MLKEDYAVLAKVKEEIASLNIRKSGIVKELNEKLLDTEVKSKSIIASAQDQANSILKDAAEVRKEVDRYASNTRTEAANYLHVAKKGAEEYRIEKAKLDNDVIDFEAGKVAFENDMRRLRNEANALMVQANEKQKELSDREINLNTLNSSINRKSLEQSEELAVIVQGHEAINKAKEELAKKELALADMIAKDKLLKEFNEKAIAELYDKQKKIDLDMEAVKTLAKECAETSIKQNEQKASINAQFEILDKTNKTLEEKKQSLDEKLELLGIKSKEVDEKLVVLAQTRSKRG